METRVNMDNPIELYISLVLIFFIQISCVHSDELDQEHVDIINNQIKPGWVVRQLTNLPKLIQMYLFFPKILRQG